MRNPAAKHSRQLPSFFLALALSFPNPAFALRNEMAAETGLFGLFAFFWILLIFFKIGLGYLSRKKDYLVLGFLSGILAFLVHAFFDTHLYSLQLVVLFWFMFGLTAAVIKLGQKEKGETQE